MKVQAEDERICRREILIKICMTRVGVYFSEIERYATDQMSASSVEREQLRPHDKFSAKVWAQLKLKARPLICVVASQQSFGCMVWHAIHLEQFPGSAAIDLMA
jgi:hypothetical protein